MTFSKALHSSYQNVIAWSCNSQLAGGGQPTPRIGTIYNLDDEYYLCAVHFSNIITQGPASGTYNLSLNITDVNGVNHTVSKPMRIPTLEL